MARRCGCGWPRLTALPASVVMSLVNLPNALQRCRSALLLTHDLAEKIKKAAIVVEAIVNVASHLTLF